MAKGQMKSTKEARKPKKEKGPAKPVKETIKLPEPATVARGKAKNK